MVTSAMGTTSLKMAFSDSHSRWLALLCGSGSYSSVPTCRQHEASGLGCSVGAAVPGPDGEQSTLLRSTLNALQRQPDKPRTACPV